MSDVISAVFGVIFVCCSSCVAKANDENIERVERDAGAANSVVHKSPLSSAIPAAEAVLTGEEKPTAYTRIVEPWEDDVQRV